MSVLFIETWKLKLQREVWKYYTKYDFKENFDVINKFTEININVAFFGKWTSKCDHFKVKLSSKLFYAYTHIQPTWKICELLIKCGNHNTIIKLASVNSVFLTIGKMAFMCMVKKGNRKDV